MKLKVYSNKEKLEVLAKTYLTNKDIQVLCDCGLASAIEIRKAYKEYAVRNNIYDFDKVATEDFVEFKHINVKHIEKYARMGY